MGAYLAKPDTEKTVSSGKSKNGHIRYAHSSMQGWRINMEDAHMAVPNLNTLEDLACFGVFDGHGGSEVAQLCEQKLPEMLARTVGKQRSEIEAILKSGNVDKLKILLAGVLHQTLMEMDARILEPKTIKDLKELSNINNSEPDSAEGEDREQEIKDLCEEAELSIEELRARYGNAAQSGSPLGVDTNSYFAEPEQPSEPQGSSNSKKPTKPPPKPENSTADASPEPSAAAKSLHEQLEADYTNDSSDTDASPSGSGSSSEEEGAGEEDLDDKVEEDLNEELLKEQQFLKKFLTESVKVGTEEEMQNRAGVDSGTTAVIGMMTSKGHLICANSGDSRCLVGRYCEEEKTYKAIDMSIDHKPEDPIELRRIKLAGGCISADGRVDGGLNLSRAVGDHFYKRHYKSSLGSQKITAKPDIRHIQLTNQDHFIVLACDGIWNVMPSQEVAQRVGTLLEKKMSLQEITSHLLDYCLAPDTKGDGTGCDNMTAVVVEIDPEYRKTLPSIEDFRQGTYQHIEEDKEDDLVANEAFENSPFSIPFTNPTDGSSQFVGEFLNGYKQIDYDWNGDIDTPLDQHKWVLTETMAVDSCALPPQAVVTNGKENGEKTAVEKESSKDEDDAPPSKKQKV